MFGEMAPDPEAAAIRAFLKLFEKLTDESKKSLCDALGEVEDELYSGIYSAARDKDVRRLDSLIEELKYVTRMLTSCRLPAAPKAIKPAPYVT